MDKGSRVKVVKGRKVPIDTTGTIFWLGDNKFGEGKRAGIEGDDGETYWTSLDNLEAIQDEAPEIEPPKKGDMVRFILPEAEVEVEGPVIWVGEAKSGRGYRIGVRDHEGEVHWMDSRKATPVGSVAEDGDDDDAWDEEAPPF